MRLSRLLIAIVAAVSTMNAVGCGGSTPENTPAAAAVPPPSRPPGIPPPPDVAAPPHRH